MFNHINLDEAAAQSLVGKQISGRNEKVACEQYDFTVPETGEVISLQYTSEYLPENEPTQLQVVHSNLAA